jgi:hypothetical protein
LEQTLEHLPNPGVLLDAIASNQAPGGILYIAVPGVLAYPKNYDNNFLQYLQYGHLFHYTLHTLERLVLPFGYRLVRGTETIQAAFIRISGELTPPHTPAQNAQEIIDLLQNAERKFRAKGSHLLRHFRNYLRYGSRWVLCAIYPFKRIRPVRR